MYEHTCIFTAHNVYVTTVNEEQRRTKKNRQNEMRNADVCE